MTDWIAEYFVNPLANTNDFAPYNVVNTLVFAVLALFAAYLIYSGLQKFKIKIDSKFFRAIMPFVFFGAFVRVLEDSGVLPRSVEALGWTFYPFVTPYIYVLTFLVVIASMAIAKKTSKTSEGFSCNLFAIGAALALFAMLCLFVLTDKRNFVALAEIAAFAAIPALAYAIWQKRATYREKTLFVSQALDGSATFVGVALFGYSEQHLLGNAIFALGTPLLFYAIKMLFAIVAIELIRREKLGDEEKTYLLLLITIFGLAPGIRDATRVFLGV
ncbi:MAG: DUF63 family protein [Candidatus Micrarchaeota archaeon]